MYNNIIFPQQDCSNKTRRRL